MTKLCIICKREPVNDNNYMPFDLCTKCDNNMRIGKRHKRTMRCLRCQEIKPLTNHSLVGGDMAYFVLVYRKCHDEIEIEKRGGKI